MGSLTRLFEDIDRLQQLQQAVTNGSDCKDAVEMCRGKGIVYGDRSDISGLVQDSGNSIAKSMEIPQYCFKPSL